MMDDCTQPAMSRAQHERALELYAEARAAMRKLSFEDLSLSGEAHLQLSLALAALDDFDALRMGHRRSP